MALPSADATAVALLTDFGNDNGTLRDEFVSGLVQGSAWMFGGGPRIITWSLNINEDYTTYPAGQPEPGPGGEWGDAPGMAQAVADALAAWSNVANITFQQIAAPPDEYYFESSADLAITLTGDDLDRVFGQAVAGAAMFPDAAYVEGSVYSDEGGIDRATWPTPEGDVFLDNYEAQFDYLEPGGAGFTVILHELGHALGIKHPHDGGSDDRPTFSDLGIGSMDQMRHTVMSYDIVADPPGAQGFAATPMPLDILAIQHIYGANLTYRAGDDVYDLENESYRTIWDAGGEDAVSAASWSQSAMIDLREGAFSGLLDGAKRMAVAYDAVIENAIGSSFADKLRGNRADNELSGGAGRDALFGRLGDDTLTGGTGADRLYGQRGDDVLFFNPADTRLDGGAGTDVLVITQRKLNLTKVASGVINDIEHIDMTGGDDSRLILGAADLLDLSRTSDTLTIFGDAGDAVRFEGAVDKGMDGTFQRYRLGAAILLVDTDITVI